MQVSKLLASKTFGRLPLSIQHHPVFTQISKIEKPFPSFGLLNFLERCEVDYDNKPAYIGFSSVGLRGLWDIATMSMRGACSCMHWENFHFSHLVGSVTDPFLGIIYVSDNTLTPHGISFKRRALVRLVHNTTSKENAILIERVYFDTGNKDPRVYNNIDPHQDHTLALFKKFLTSKVDGKIRVILSTERAIVGHYYAEIIPRPTSVGKITSTYHSMSDCGLRYHTVDDEFLNKFSEQG